MASPNHGGKRAGAGRPAGTKNASTISKEQARDALRAVIISHMDEMVAAQVAHSKGLKYLVYRDKSGKFVKVTQEMMDAWAKGTQPEDITLEVWEKDPSVQAFTDLMNRALDKPKEQEQEHNISGELKISWLPPK